MFVKRACYYCGDRAETKDHYIPTALGGTTDVNNLVPACVACNNAKGQLIPEAFFAFCAEVVTQKLLKHEKFRAKAKAILLKHAPELLVK